MGLLRLAFSLELLMIPYLKLQQAILHSPEQPPRENPIYAPALGTQEFAAVSLTYCVLVDPKPSLSTPVFCSESHSSPID